MNKQKVIILALILLTSVILLYFLWWHYTLGIERYFDVDEFAHLKWARRFSIGDKPYIDFMLFFPPGFYWFLAPIFWFFGDVTPFYIARGLMFGVFVGIVGLTVALFWLKRKSWIAVVPGMILAFLPLPFDKFLEVRPDNLAALLFLIGLYCQVKWLDSHSFPNGQTGSIDYGKRTHAFISGLMYSAALVVLPKMVPPVAVSIGIFVIAGLFIPGSKKTLRYGAGGLAVPILMSLLWALSLGNLDAVIYSLTKLPFEANKISMYFVMMPDLFFYPNTIFYGEGGYSLGLIVNHAVWIISLFVAVYRFCTPYLATGSKQNPQRLENALSEFLIASIFIVQAVIYVSYIPLKHTQYLIPIAVFVGWYAGDGVYLVWERLKNVRGVGISMFSLVFIIGTFYLYKAFNATNGPKRNWTNKEVINELEYIYSQVPKDEYLMDLDGRTLYYKDPYPVCCLPFGQFAQFLSRKLPSLSQTLESSGTKYIWAGNRMETLGSEDQAYIASVFEPVAGTNLWRRK